VLSLLVLLDGYDALHGLDTFLVPGGSDHITAPTLRLTERLPRPVTDISAANVSAAAAANVNPSLSILDGRPLWTRSDPEI
jgi:hypothetical protein